MNRLAFVAAFVVLLSGAAPAWSQGGDFPPVIVGRDIYVNDVLQNIDPLPAIANIDVQERDIITLVIEVEIIRDGDDPIDPDEDDIELYYGKQSLWDPVEGYPTPIGGPFEGDTSFGDYIGVPFNYLGNNRFEIAVSFRVPEFTSVNQARLRGIVDYDVRWNVFVQVWDSDTSEVDDPVPGFVFEVDALEDPALRPASNPPPFANAGTNVAVEAGSTVVLDGSDTFDSFNLGFDVLDPDVFLKDNLVYDWEWVSGPVRVDPVPSDDADEPWLATVQLDEVGAYMFRLFVDDGVNQLPSTDVVTINVLPEISDNNTPRAVVIAPDEPVVVGEVLTLDGSASVDPDGDTLSFRWRQTDEVGGDLPPDEFATRFQPLSGLEASVSRWQAIAPGTYYFRLLVDDGELVDTEFVSVEVTSAQAAGVSFDAGAQAATENDAGESEKLLLAPAGCGAGLLPLVAVPLLLFCLRGRAK